MSRGILLPDRYTDFGFGAPVAEPFTDSVYRPEIDCLRATDGGTDPLEDFDTKSYATGAKIEIVIGDPPSEQSLKLLTGTADSTIPYDEVDAYNSDPDAAARHWKKVGGY